MSRTTELDLIAYEIYNRGARADNTTCHVLSRGDAYLRWRVSHWPFSADCEYCVVDAHSLEQPRTVSEQELCYVKNKLKEVEDSYKVNKDL